MNNITTRIEPLGKENFDTWKLQVEALLIKNDCCDFVSGEKVMPKVEAGNAASENALRTWMEGDRKARSDLILAINPSELKQIKNCLTSNAVWNKLHEIYQSKGPARKATLLKRLILHKMGEGTNIRTHIAEFFDAVDKLLDMGISVNDDLLAIMLLYSLPGSFDNFRCAIESRDELPNPEALKIKILEEFDARKCREKENHQNAMFVRRPLDSKEEKDKEYHRKPQSKFYPKVFKFKCHNCRKIGHKASECRQDKRRTYERTESSKVCTEENHFDPGTEFALKHSDGNNVCGRDDWCLDSGCTSHMTSMELSFDHLRKAEKSLNLANGETTSIHGIGSVRISASDGENTQHLKLEDVMFVPDLRTNLMSVAKVADKGCEIRFNKEAASIIAPDGKLLVMAERRGDLYYVRKGNEIANFSTPNTKSFVDE